MNSCLDNIYMQRIPETINFSDEEEKVLLLWKELNVFYTCLKHSEGKPRYSFYDGPPFATGLPHYGHILAGTIKDVVTRYAHQQGYYVERRFGWDCHGLPVEFEIDKKLGIKGPEDVINIGIAKYNNECRKIVARYANEWETIMVRLGRWIDFKNDYKTLYPWFMESVWWVFKQLYDKGLVYQGNKVMPYSTACSTPLSNFESGQNYKDVIDPAIVVTLPVIDDADGACLLIWTTTPWTLPSNLAACVNPTLQYVKIRQISSGKVYLLMEARLEAIFPIKDYEIINKFPGYNLKDWEYEPIFPYFKELQAKGAFKVLVDDYVTSECGTGVVHQAPYFGEDDFRVCLAAGLITNDREPICPVDASGKFVKPVFDFEGQYVKDADKNIILMLRKTGRLFSVSQVKHSYPFCWRSDTPLIYKAVPSWFVRVEHMRENLQKCSASTHWVPEYVKNKRFVNWLKDARDWAVSRNRYWGTPIPIWMSRDGDEICCIGSISELEQLSGTKITDIHRESIDQLLIPSKIAGNPPLKRISEVFDCWFESGSMPYAQQHYPFEHCKEFKETFPADFVAEGIDQTRGWFYTLLVISTALFGQAPFKNLVCNGLVLASDGQKMSKRKKNYPDPMEIVSKYGADSLRLYLINSPVVRAENLRFKEEGVRDIIKDVFLPWYNAFRFLMQSITSYVHENNTVFLYSENDIHSTNIMDRWMLSFTQSLLKFIKREMALYHLYNVVPRLINYINCLTNWYVRMNRKRFKGNGGTEDWKQCLLTLFSVIYNIIKIMSPFSPFLSETMYQMLKHLTIEKCESVHYLMLPQPNNDMINVDIERSVAHMQAVIEIARIIRDRKTIPIKHPLPEIIVIHQSQDYINDILSLQLYILSELNIRLLTTTTDKNKYRVSSRAEPDHKILGTRLKQEFKIVSSAIKLLTDEEINEMIDNGYRTIAGHRIESSEVRIILKSEIISTRYEVHSDNDVFILLDCTPDIFMIDEGISREIINRIQKLRKKAHLVPIDKITVFYKADGKILSIAESFVNYIEESIQASFRKMHLRTNEDVIILEEHQTLKNCNLFITLTKRMHGDETVPVTKWANIQVLEINTSFCNGANKAVILLKAGKEEITVDQFKKEITSLFGITSNFNIFTSNGRLVTGELSDLSGQTLFISEKYTIPLQNECHEPFCKVRNFYEDGVSGTLILENPKDIKTNVEEKQKEFIGKWKTVFKT